ARRCLGSPPPPRSPPFPYTTLFRSVPGYVDRTGVHIPVVGDLPLACAATCSASVRVQQMGVEAAVRGDVTLLKQAMLHDPLVAADRKSTRLNSSHVKISYAVFCLKK